MKDDLHLVVLNACHSLVCATELAELVGCAIGVAEEISDKTAIIFASDFYGAVAAGRSIQNAFDQAIASLEFQGVDADNAPQLVCRKGVEAVKLCLNHDEEPAQ